LNIRAEQRLKIKSLSDIFKRL